MEEEEEDGSGGDGLRHLRLHDEEEEEDEENGTRDLRLGKLTRRVSQRRRHSLVDHLRSIYLDAHFVLSVAEAYRARASGGGGGREQALPIYANLRNGEWYLPPRQWDGRCYFKSTDGHSGQWAFSLPRLNLHLALDAARRGGALVVDSTRRGKAYPDALVYTVPIWCAVISGYVASLVEPKLPSQHQDYLFLPPWVPPSEQDRVRARLPSFYPRLAEVISASDREELLSLLTITSGSKGKSFRPLRPVWIKHGDSLWMLPGLASSDDNNDEDEEGAMSLDFVPIICVSASRDRDAEEHREHFSWPYIQGAGDDAEHWARVDPSLPLLTPATFWTHVREILPCLTAALPAPAAASAEGENGEGEQSHPVNTTAAAEEEDAAVEARVRAILGEEKEGAEVLDGEQGPWALGDTGLWIGRGHASAGSDTESPRWGGVLAFVPLDKQSLQRRQQQQQDDKKEEPAASCGCPGCPYGSHPPLAAPSPSASLQCLYDEVDEGEGRRAEFAREGLPRAVAAFRRYRHAFALGAAGDGAVAASLQRPFLITAPDGPASHAAVVAAALLLSEYREEEEGQRYVLKPLEHQDDDEGEENTRPYLPSIYRRARRLGPLHARPPLPRLPGLPRLTDKEAMRRALLFVQRATAQVVPPSRALQKELFSLFTASF